MKESGGCLQVVTPNFIINVWWNRRSRLSFSTYLVWRGHRHVETGRANLRTVVGPLWIARRHHFGTRNGGSQELVCEPVDLTVAGENDCQPYWSVDGKKNTLLHDECIYARIVGGKTFYGSESGMGFSPAAK